MEYRIEIIQEKLTELLLARNDDIAEFVIQIGSLLKESPYAFNQFHKAETDIIKFNTDKTILIFILTSDNRSKFFGELKKTIESTDIESINQFIGGYDNMKNYIIIFKNDGTVLPTPQNKVLLLQFDRAMYKLGGMVHDLTFKQLLYNPLQHELVPKHTKLNTEEIIQIMTKYNIKHKSQIPFILKNDIISKWIGLRPGDIVEIERYNINSGLSYYYRCCV
jgi:DNA-directed RNA polymerase subunit H (RpoH/RPB5)